MQPFRSNEFDHDVKEPSHINVTPLDADETSVDQLRGVVIISTDTNNMAERQRKRSLDDPIFDLSKAETSLAESFFHSSNIDFQSISKKTIGHDEKRSRLANMDDPTPTVNENKSTTDVPPPIPQVDKNDENKATSGTHQNTQNNNAVGGTKAFTFNASSWSVGPRYQLLRLLGRGSYGEVAEARDLYQGEDNQKVAIKRIITAFDKEVDAIRLFREIHILRRLRGHACIIQLLDIIPHYVGDPSTCQELYLVFECTLFYFAIDW